MAEAGIQRALRFQSALLARTDLTQVAEGIDSGRMTIVPVELNGIVTDLGSARYFDGTFAQNWKGVGFCLNFGRLVTTGSTRALLAKITIGVSRLVTVIPGDGNPARRGELYRSRHGIHSALLNGNGLGRVVVGNADLGGDRAGQIVKGFGVLAIALI